MFRRSTPCCKRYLQLQDVPLQRSWDFSLPTLTQRGRFVQREDWATSNDEFLHHMKGAFPSLPHILAAAPGLYVKGGFCASVLMGRTPTDLDLYFTGCTSVEESQMRCKHVLETIVSLTVDRAVAEEEQNIESHQRHARSGRGTDSTTWNTEEVERRRHSAKQRALGRLCAIRRGAVITVTGVPGCSVPIQLSMVPYASKDLLLSESDVDCGANCFSFDESTGGLLLAQRAADSIQNWTLRATGNECSKGNAIAPFRLKSYFERGFDIILPEFDPSKVALQHPRSGIPTSFDLCDGQLLVEVAPEEEATGGGGGVAAGRGSGRRSSASMTPLGNRISVAGLKEKVQRGNVAAAIHDEGGDGSAEGGADGLESFTANLSGLSSASAVPSGGPITPPAMGEPRTMGRNMRDLMIGSQTAQNARYVRNLSTNAIHHNVRELLQHGKNFHVVATGGTITTIADLRAVPVTQRNLDTTLHSLKERVLQDPFGTATLQHLLQFFPVQHPLETLKEIMPPKSVFDSLAGKDEEAEAQEATPSVGGDGGKSNLLSFDDHLRAAMEGVHDKQMAEAVELLARTQKELGAEALSNLLPDPVSYEVETPKYYGPCYKPGGVSKKV